MFLKILKMILYFFVIFAKPVYADNFDGTGDTSSNQYFQTIAFTVSDYPHISNILYEQSNFIAESTQSVLNSPLESFTDFDNTRRIPMVADHVDAPPGTQVDIVYLYKNSTGHSVNISKVNWVLSRNIVENGNLADLLDINGYTEENLSYKYSHQNLIKSGIYKEYPGMGNIENGVGGVYVLDSVKVKNPLNIDEVKVALNSESGVDFEIYIQNNGDEYLNNLKFTYGPHEEIFNLSAQEEHVIRFATLDIPEELGTFSIYNPNIKQVCSVYGSPYYTYTQTDSIPALAYRGENVVPGASVQPQVESFCIKRIPYTMVSDTMVLNEIEQTETKNIDSNIEEEENGDVLGISATGNILPKTGEVDWLFLGLLVVDMLLWYSVYILRRNYEGKNTNSRVCAKSK
ncbi:MAG: hypothetical protein UR96_C0023G0011 [candidate division WS6 bacterium GW2011_GWC1_36_11]|uniref:Uncharacterized protein n=1 Tax=candidate division WS6 bacterium GW2011_GWC1_36_11 TaxID=1619090 RepID=A0A0G0FXA6_9BACT|nr:MAG: hypothetical protein UR96_C0023G0011 [candidate division WS6 bacterium GW2011_GWC1_36_11]